MHSVAELAASFAGWAISSTASLSTLRLLLATLLGGAIGLERELKHRPAGLRTNIMICFGSAMFTMMSDRLAGAIGGDHTRVAAQIIPGIGFIGAGAILKERGSVSGLTSAATIFVTAGIGMAAGGGLYQTAFFATLLVILSLMVLGEIEQRFDLKRVVMTYDVISKQCESAQPFIDELNHLLDDQSLQMQTVHVSNEPSGACHVRFSVEGYHSQQNNLLATLKASPNTATVASVLVSERD